MASISANKAPVLAMRQGKPALLMIRNISMASKVMARSGASAWAFRGCRP
jgi:hypothetical protein